VSDTYIRVRNYEKFQAFKRRRPVWVKLHRDLWISPPFITLEDTTKLLYLGLTTIASEEDHIPNDIEFLYKRLAISPDIVEKGVQHLAKAGLVSVYKKPGRKPGKKSKHSPANKDLPL